MDRRNPPCSLAVSRAAGRRVKHLLLGQYFRPSLKGSWHQPTNTTPVSPGAQKAYVETIQDVGSAPSQEKRSIVVIGSDLSRRDVVRHSLQDGDAVPFDVQDAQDRTALADQRLAPVLIVGKLLPLQGQRKKVILQRTKIESLS